MFLPIISWLLLVAPAAEVLSLSTAAAHLPVGGATVTTITAAPWRIALNIGREQFSTMPFTWGSSGCRLPLVVKCDFEDDGTIRPQEEYCRFTGPDGQVVKPVEKGQWSISKNNKLEFTLNLPEKLQRRDVVLQDGTQLICDGLVYSKEELDEMNELFYKARDKTWKAGQELNDIARRKEAPLKWDAYHQKWVKRYEDEPILSTLGKRFDLFTAKLSSDRQKANRPDPKRLSMDCGPFPGCDGNVYIQKGGNIRIKKGLLDAVIGTWSAEPINDKPVSYYSL